MRQKVKKSVSILPEGEEKIILEILNFNSQNKNQTSDSTLFFFVFESLKHSHKKTGG